jgi:hypothetical protein
MRGSALFAPYTSVLESSNHALWQLSKLVTHGDVWSVGLGGLTLFSFELFFAHTFLGPELLLGWLGHGPP